MIEDCWVPEPPREASGYYCENCGEAILEYEDSIYTNEEGQLFCSLNCMMEHYGVTEYDWREYDLEREEYDIEKNY